MRTADKNLVAVNERGGDLFTLCNTLNNSI